MEDNIDTLVISVRADTQAFARDVADMRQGLEGPLATGADKAGRAIENGLLRAVKTGKFGFEDLRRVALSVLDGIANSAIRGGLASIGVGGASGAGGGGGLLNLGASLLGSILGGAPGRATGGPVSPGRPYRVGENGPELFVPTGSGQIMSAGQGGGRDVRVSINVTAPENSAPQALSRSARQIARSVRGALRD
ncbi:MAG: tail tape measure protein [Sphingobium sp.]